MAHFLLVFDLDGTLVDSVPDLTNTLNKVLRERGHAPLTRSEVAPMVGDGVPALVARAFAVEYGLLGAAAGVGGTVLATVLAWAVVRWVLDAPWSFDPTPLLIGLAATVALALAVGFLVTFRLLGQKPLPVLRRE